MKKGGLADSPFFSMLQPAEPQSVQPSTHNAPSVTPSKRTPARKRKQSANNKRRKQNDTVIPRHRDTMLDTTTPRYHDTMIETVRKAVKAYGKEAATHRFTLEEKKAIADIIYAYKQRGVKSSENEIARIAINFIIEDYAKNGENSVLHQAVTALNT